MVYTHIHEMKSIEIFKPDAISSVKYKNHPVYNFVIII